MPSIRSEHAGSQVAAIPMVVARADSMAPAPYDRPGSTFLPALETSVDAGSRSDTPVSALPRDAAVDADEIVERAWREVMSRLAIEQERRGFGRWS
jgi:hypothetical protein